MVWALCVFVMLFSSCQKAPQERRYTEITSEAPQGDSRKVDPHAGLNVASDPHAGLDMSAIGAMITASASQNMLAWSLPGAWKEEAGTHMRMASFYSASDPQAIDCYIIALKGPAGGLQANLARWSQQIGLRASQDNLDQLAHLAQDLRTKDGLYAQVFDFTGLQRRDDPSDKSMMAAMIPLDNVSVFVKMTGSIRSVRQNKAYFLELIRSLVRK
jgi:hypothetical protein